MAYKNANERHRERMQQGWDMENNAERRFKAQQRSSQQMHQVQENAAAQRHRDQMEMEALAVAQREELRQEAARAAAAQEEAARIQQAAAFAQWRQTPDGMKFMEWEEKSRAVIGGMKYFDGEMQRAYQEDLAIAQARTPFPPGKFIETEIVDMAAVDSDAKSSLIFPGIISIVLILLIVAGPPLFRGMILLLLITLAWSIWRWSSRVERYKSSLRGMNKSHLAKMEAQWRNAVQNNLRRPEWIVENGVVTRWCSPSVGDLERAYGEFAHRARREFPAPNQLPALVEPRLLSADSIPDGSRVWEVAQVVHEFYQQPQVSLSFVKYPTAPAPRGSANPMPSQETLVNNTRIIPGLDPSTGRYSTAVLRHQDGMFYPPPR